jgi:non-specific serine/threonine protein kinase
VILAARITDRARGGEILVSSLLKELVDSAGDIEFGEPRKVELKGLAGSRTLHAVQWAGAPALEATRTSGEHVFRCEGEYWTLAFAGSVCRLRDAKGLHHIADLLRHPGRQFDVRELAAEGNGGDATVSRAQGAEAAGAQGMAVGDLGDAGAMLDPKAKAAYKQRLDELRDELEEAESFNDTGRAAAAREEIDFITVQLAAAVGLGGRDRKVASASERARLTVTKRIKDALGRIRESHPALGEYLVARIKTGYLCGYSADPGAAVVWEL